MDRSASGRPARCSHDRKVCVQHFMSGPEFCRLMDERPELFRRERDWIKPATYGIAVGIVIGYVLAYLGYPF